MLIPGLPGLRLALGQELGHSYDSAPGVLRRCLSYRPERRPVRREEHCNDRDYADCAAGGQRGGRNELRAAQDGGTVPGPRRTPALGRRGNFRQGGGMAGQEACRAGTVALAAGRHLPGSRWARRWAVLRADSGLLVSRAGPCSAGLGAISGSPQGCRCTVLTHRPRRPVAEQGRRAHPGLLLPPSRAALRRSPPSLPPASSLGARAHGD